MNKLTKEIEALYEKNINKYLNYAKTFNSVEPEDIIQEVFLKLLNYKDLKNDNIEALIYQIIKTTAIDQQKKRDKLTYLSEEEMNILQENNKIISNKQHKKKK